MIKNKLSISHTSYNIIDKNSNKIGFREARKIEYKDLIKSCDIGLSTVMIKKDIIKKKIFCKIKNKRRLYFMVKIGKKKFCILSNKETINILEIIKRLSFIFSNSKII